MECWDMWESIPTFRTAKLLYNVCAIRLLPPFYSDWITSFAADRADPPKNDVGFKEPPLRFKKRNITLDGEIKKKHSSRRDKKKKALIKRNWRAKCCCCCWGGMKKKKLRCWELNWAMRSGWIPLIGCSNFFAFIPMLHKPYVYFYCTVCISV